MHKTFFEKVIHTLKNNEQSFNVQKWKALELRRAEHTTTINEKGYIVSRHLVSKIIVLSNCFVAKILPTFAAGTAGGIGQRLKPD